MNDVDPRFNGEADGQVWYARTAFGNPDANGTRAGVTREVIVATSAVADERTLAVSDKYVPGRVVLDVSQASSQNESLYQQFSVISDATDVVDGALGSQTPPITLYAGTYSLTASLADSNGNAPASPGTTCTEPITIDASSDVTFFAKFSAKGCAWSPTDK